MSFETIPAHNTWFQRALREPLLHFVFLGTVIFAIDQAVVAVRGTPQDIVVPKAAFDEAWLWYRCATKREVDVQCYLHYMSSTSTTNNAHGGQTVIKEDGQGNFKRNVDRLLKFAQDV